MSVATDGGPRVLAWVRVLRPLAQANIAPYVLLGVALGVSRRGHFEPIRTLWAVGLGLLVHAVVILTNEHGDWEADREHAHPTLVSGGSGVAATGWLKRSSVGRAAVLAAGLLLASSLALVPTTDPGVPLLAAAAIFLSWSYSHPPLRLGYRGHGASVQAVGVGIVLPALAYGVQTGRTSDLPWLAFLPVSLLGFAGHITTALPDLAGDRRAGKRTLPVIAGARISALVAGNLTLAACALVPSLTLRAHPERLLWALGLAASLAIAAHLRAFRREPGLRFVILQSLASLTLLLGWTWALVY